MESKERRSTSGSLPSILQPSQSRGCDQLLDRESYKMEYKAPNLEERASRKLEAPPIEYGAPKQERTR